MIYVSITCLIIFSPLFAIIVLANQKLGSPVLFRQIRPGKNGHPFEMTKFQCVIWSIAMVCLLPDEEKNDTWHFLRSTSFDELPELWNVLKGDMSLVGPRPLLMEYLPLYNPEQYRRHEVRPGITGAEAG